MRILMIAINDPAGTAIEFTNAVNRHTEHNCRLITKEIRYNFMFEKDLHLPWLNDDGWEEVEYLLRTSDVFHFHMTADEYLEIGPFKPVDYIHDKIIVHHHHGHPDFRSKPDTYRQKYRRLGRRNLLVSTPDLLKLLPEARWQPNLVPIDDPLYMPLADKPDEPVIICHSPTRKALKNTKEFTQVVGELKNNTTVTIEMRIIENTPHKECLRLKQKSHILFDHIQGYFGVSSLEGLSQGLPVIAGIDEWNQQKIREYFSCDELPWITAGCSSELKQKIIDLVESEKKRNECGEKSRQFMESYWTAHRAIKTLVDVYNGRHN